MAKYGDFATLDALSGGDVTKYEEVSKMGIRSAFTKLKYDMDKAAYQTRLNESRQKSK